MTDAIEGRWLLETGRAPADPGSNVFTLADGRVALSKSGRAAGHYEVQPGQLTITLLMADIAGEGPWQMVVRLILPEPLEHVGLLPGIIEAIVADEAPSLVGSCVLLRQDADA